MKPDDITIFDYVSKKDIDGYRPKNPKTLDDARLQANKQVAHLTSQRLIDYRDEKKRIWKYREIAIELMDVLNKLEPYFYPNRITEDVRSYLRSEISIYLFDISWNEKSMRIPVQGDQ